MPPAAQECSGIGHRRMCRASQGGLRRSAVAAPQAGGLRPEETGGAKLLAHFADTGDAAPRKDPCFRSEIDGAIDVEKLLFTEPPAARLERLKLDGNSEVAHRSFAVDIEETFKVAEP